MIFTTNSFKEKNRRCRIIAITKTLCSLINFEKIFKNHYEICQQICDETLLDILLLVLTNMNHTYKLSLSFINSIIIIKIKTTIQK